MKYIVILGDGMADRPIETLEGKTLLEAAKTPILNSLAGKGTMGVVTCLEREEAENVDLEYLLYRKFYETTGKKGNLVSVWISGKEPTLATNNQAGKIKEAESRADNEEGNVQMVIDALLKEKCDFAFLSYEIDKQNTIEDKMQAIESFDKEIVNDIKEQMDASGESYRILFLARYEEVAKAESECSLSMDTYAMEPVPFLLYDNTRELRKIGRYNEREAMESGLVVESGEELLSLLLE